MLALRRVATIHSYVYPLTSYQIRYKSKKHSNDDSDVAKGKSTTSLSQDLLNFDRKDTNTKVKPRFDNKQSLSRTDKETVRREKKPFNPNEKLNLAKPFDANQKKFKRDGEQTGQKSKKVHPNVILDTESDEVRTITRQVADSLTPNNPSNDSNNPIEQELLDALRGHRIVSKTDRRSEKKLEKTQENIESPKKQFDKTKKRTRTSSPSTANIDVDKTTDAFSSLLRDIKLKPAGESVKTSLDELDGEKIRPRSPLDREDRRDNFESRRSPRDNKRRQEFMKPHQLWSGDALGIFSSQDSTSTIQSSLWQKHEQEELIRASSIPPRNAFEEMIQWTNDGILWKFPIDNEQDLGSDGDVPFYEHVLLERHIQNFPSSPLIRQFMELVCVGLGRNPYWTVEQKLDHINWFREFFNEKINVFNETVHTGAVKSSTTTTAAATKPASTYKPKPVATPAAPKPPPVVPPSPPPPVASKK